MLKNKLFLLIPVFLLASCGVDIYKVASPNIDHSRNWHDNYFTYFKEELKDVETNKVTLDRNINKVFTSYDDQNFKDIESEQANLDYYNDFASNGYGTNKKLSKYNEEIKDGFVSKLYDGQFFCYGNYELARVQINENGFSSSFYHKLVSADYLYLNFKSALDFKTYSPGAHNDVITIHISFYGENNVTYSYQLDNVPTNNGESYIFYGFSLKGLDIKNSTDYSISYTLNYDAGREIEPSIEHALLLYEFGLSNPIFE